MSNEVYPTAIVVDHNRVQHYDEVIDQMVQSEIYRCRTKEQFTPTPSQIQFFRKELVRHIVIRRKIEFAQTIKITKSNVLNETHSLHPRDGKQR